MKTRNTLFKHIAAGKSKSEKWLRAVYSGKPPTEIESLVQSAHMWRSLPSDTPARQAAEQKTLAARQLPPPSESLVEAHARALRELKQRFADLLFPELMKGDPAQFQKLIQAMVAQKRRHELSTAEWNARVQPKLDKILARCKGRKPTKEELQPAIDEITKMRHEKTKSGLLLRQALSSPCFEGEHRRDIRSVEKYLESWQLEFDERNVRRVLQELGKPLTKAPTSSRTNKR